MKCRVCNITEKDYLAQTGNRFYDSGVYRPLCSRACYAVICDNLSRGKEQAMRITRRIVKKQRESVEGREAHNAYMREYKLKRKQKVKGMVQ